MRAARTRQSPAGWAGLGRTRAAATAHLGQLGLDRGKIRVRLHGEQQGTWDRSGGDGATLI